MDKFGVSFGVVEVKNSMVFARVFVLVCKHVQIEATDKISARLMTVDFMVSGVKMRIVNCYAPTNTYSLGVKDEFYQDLENCCKIKSGSKRKLLAMGDFNAFCSIFHEKCDFNGNLQQLDAYECSESGQMFLDFCEQEKLGSLASFFHHKFCQRATFYSNDGRTVRTYDHILTSSWLRKYTRDCRVRNSVNIDNDHRCVVANLAIPKS